MIGERIGSYVVTGELAVGGFGAVYTGRATSGRDVAIKVLLAEHVGSSAVERFEREIAIVRRLHHPNIVELLDAGRLPDGRPYCVMELLEGRDLAVVLETERLAPERVADIIAAIGGALAVAHGAGVVHRDIKPTNVFVCNDGRVVLLDFGIAKLLAGDLGITMSRQTLGTVGSMAPEQLVAGAIDTRTDVYALGVLAYHALTGAPPFSGDAAAQLHRFAQRPRPSVHGAPTVFDPIITRAMAIRPVDRYASVTELVDAIRGALGAATRDRRRAIAIHVDGLRAPHQLRRAIERLAGCEFRPIATGAITAVWWRALAATDQREPGLHDLLRELAALGVGVAVHVDDLDTDAGQAAGGPLAELWRWVPAVPSGQLVMTQAARDILEPI